MTKNYLCKIDLYRTIHKGAAVNMMFFDYKHLPEYLQEISKPFHELAHMFNDTMPDCSEKTAGLRKLLEAKDCFVRVEAECASYVRQNKNEINNSN